MMKLTCKDLDHTTTCNFEATGETATEVAQAMLAHAKIEHAEKLLSTSEEDMLNMMTSKVHI